MNCDRDCKRTGYSGSGIESDGGRKEESMEEWKEDVRKEGKVSTDGSKEGRGRKKKEGWMAE